MEKAIPIAQAKARFAECVRRAEAGERVILTRHGRPVARLTPVEPGLEPPGDGVREPESRYNFSRATGEAPVSAASRREALERLLEERIWPRIPEEQLGKTLGKSEREKILGYGSDGV